MSCDSIARRIIVIDLNLRTSYDAAHLLSSWIDLRQIKILNVAGSRASRDPTVSIDVFRNLSSA